MKTNVWISSNENFSSWFYVKVFDSIGYIEYNTDEGDKNNSQTQRKQIALVLDKMSELKFERKPPNALLWLFVIGACCMSLIVGGNLFYTIIPLIMFSPAILFSLYSFLLVKWVKATFIDSQGEKKIKYLNDARFAGYKAIINRNKSLMRALSNNSVRLIVNL